MSEYVASLMAEVKAKNPAEPEFHQAVQEVAESLALVCLFDAAARLRDESRNPTAERPHARAGS